MSDFSNRKPAIGATYPAEAQTLGTKGAAGFNRVEPFLSVDKLKNRWLFGIPLKSPITKQEMSDDTIKDIINTAASQVELECHIDVFPVTRVKKIDFDRTKFMQGWNQINLGTRNIREVHELSIRTTNSYAVQNGIVSPTGDPTTDPSNEGVLIYSYPLNYIDMGSHARKGLLHVVPLQSTLNGTTPGAAYSGAAAALFSVFDRLANIPSFWYCKYTSGFEENSIPSIVNNLIGTLAAMEILSTLAALNKNNSQSIGLDGASQSVSGAGTQVYSQRYQELQAKSEELKGAIKAYFSQKIYMDNI